MSKISSIRPVVLTEHRPATNRHRQTPGHSYSTALAQRRAAKRNTPTSSPISSYIVICFYRAMLCIRGTSHGPVSVRLSVCLSVCPSVTSRCSTKTAERRITQTTPRDTPGTLVFWCQRAPRNSTGVTPYEGAECRWGGSKSATFDKWRAISRKRYKIDT